MLSYAKIATSELECKKHGCFEAAKNLTFELNTACTSLRSLKKNGAHKHRSLFSRNFASKYSRHVVLCSYDKNLTNNFKPSVECENIR